MKCILLITAFCFILSCSCNQTEKISNDIPKEITQVQEQEKVTETVSDTPTQAETTIAEIPTDISEPDMCVKLEEFLNNSGYTLSDIEHSEQLITVESDNCQCSLTAYEFTGNSWNEYYSANGIVGKDGVSENSSENNCCTPKGIFNMGFAFGTEEIDGLSVEYRKINENCYWIDDPESELYNQWVESDEITWNSAEHLIDYPESYRYAVSIEYNINPVVPYAGSAIFLHCDNGSYNYTAGCVAIPEKDMLHILEWLNENKNPVIIII